MPNVRCAMSWQTPLRSDHASWALVRTPVEPGTYSTLDRTQSAMACAAPDGEREPASEAACSARTESTVVSGVAARVSACASTVDDSRSEDHDAAPATGTRSVVSTRLDAVTRSCWCGRCRSNTVTWVPQ